MLYQHLVRILVLSYLFTLMGIAGCGGGKVIYHKPTENQNNTNQASNNNNAPELTCNDGIKNGDESDVDCGGTECSSCDSGKHCAADQDCDSLVCTTNICQVPSCEDNKKNGFETSEDCGGPLCDACSGTDAECKVHTDCISRVCIDEKCQSPSCYDGVFNGNEVDQDCGGDCMNETPPILCAMGADCTQHGDCVSGVCQEGLCRDISCQDSIKNGDESDIDCGGLNCGSCDDGDRCREHSDCQSNACASFTCQVPSCNDNRLNQDEIDIDCSGSCPNLCANGSDCLTNVDCESNQCIDNQCRPTTCNDNQKNGDETGVDCGGSCPGCISDDPCVKHSDCLSKLCDLENNICQEPACDDGVTNGDETGVDCGGLECNACAAGQVCEKGWDCISLVCSIEMKCASPTCSDNTQNSDESDIDCGGTVCGPCETDSDCTENSHCLSGVCDLSTNKCLDPACDDNVQNGDESDIDCGGGTCVICDEGKSCFINSDCINTLECIIGRCVDAALCSNLQKDTGEIDIDCGGSCPPCSSGNDCETAGPSVDCISGVCGSDLKCADPTCTDTVQNQDETSVDCGGILCTSCGVGEPCIIPDDCSTGVCTTSRCQAAQCDDNLLNGNETDVDCGGTCAPCPDGGLCAAAGLDPDGCLSGVCGSDLKCADPACDDTIQNGDETDTDCGGSCSNTCAVGEHCISGADCTTEVCGSANQCDNPPCICQAASCVDTIQNGDETDIDCGGSCVASDGAKCEDGAHCTVDADCVNNQCANSICIADHCSNTDIDFDETDLNCGGAACLPCSTGQECNTGRDCDTGSCGNDNSCAGPPTCQCQDPTCTDQVVNGDETDIDCGGATCNPCNEEDACLINTDCISLVCTNEICQAPRCDDLAKNGLETGVDCGGVCMGCPDGDPCAVDSDCLSQKCNAGTLICDAPTCNDNKKNGDETDVDCGGLDVNCQRCSTGESCVLATDCVSNICTGGVCVSSTCGDGIVNGLDECDDNNTIDTDDCRNNCTRPVCGDNFWSEHATGAWIEVCDDGNTDDCTGACKGDCSGTVSISGCGDAVVCGGEVCDDGNTDDCTGTCLGDCTAVVSITGCSDSVVCGSEECDDGNALDTDNCRNDCTLPVCNDGFLSVDAMGIYKEECEDSNQVDTDDCRNDCTRPMCGDGFESVDATGGWLEVCDDGDTSDCTGTCAGDCSHVVNRFGCGDGYLCDAEVCDDGNTDNCTGVCLGDCSALVVITGCSDGIICGTEVCDGSNVGTQTCVNAGYSGGILTCNATCDDYNEFACTDGCGNNRIEGAEKCDGPSLTEDCTDLGYTAGILSCNATCDGYIETGCTGGCGNNIADTGAPDNEVCDGTDDGGYTCITYPSSPFTGGTLGLCNATCDGFDVSSCTGGCGNDLVEIGLGEICDNTATRTDMDECTEFQDGGSGLNYTDGTLGACNATCDGFDLSNCTRCGDNTAEGNELCDGSDDNGHDCTTIGLGLTGGTLGACQGGCTNFDTSGCTTCGNGIIESPEVCDSQDLNNETCVGRGFDGGDLTCNSTCTVLDESGCLTCGTCPTGAICDQSTGGLCECPVFMTACPVVAPTDCVNIRTDPSNCGSCGNTCVAGEVCSAGQCISDTIGCQDPLVACNQLCVDTKVDNTYCGGCPGTICNTAGGESCVNGSCSSLNITDYSGEMATECTNGGPSISTGQGGSLDCTGNMAAVTFRWALCSCSYIDQGQTILTDGYNSTQGPYMSHCDGNTPCSLGDKILNIETECAAQGDTGICTDQMGAGIGANTYYLNDTHKTYVNGSFWSGTTGNTIGGFWCAQEIHVDGNFSTDNASIGSGGTVPDDMYVNGNVVGTGSSTGTLYIKTGGTYTNFTPAEGAVESDPVIDDPCDCDPAQIYNIAGVGGFIDTHKCSDLGNVNPDLRCVGDNNYNEELGAGSMSPLDPTIFEGKGGRLDLPCGHYYLTSITPGTSDTVAIVVHGRAALYIAGNITVNKKFTISLDSQSELDIFVGGNVTLNQDHQIGSPNFPARTRMYVAGSFIWNQPLRIAANVYAPNADVSGNQNGIVYGGLFVNSMDVGQTIAIHYDYGVGDAGEECPTECGNGVLDLTELCDDTFVGSETCATQGFAGGTLICNDTCDGYDTSGCYWCGDGSINGTEECDGTELANLNCTSGQFGFDGGTLACYPNCTFDTSGCYACGNNAIEGNELCDGTDLGGENCVTQGKDGGTISCNGSCDGFVLDCYDCGDDVLEGPEICDTNQLNGKQCSDLGFDGGALACRANCTFDTTACTVCGDLVKDAGEDCDGAALGGETCISQGFDGGPLSCNADCTINTDACTDCGDGVQEGNEECDGSDLNSTVCEDLGFAPGGSLVCTAQCDFDTSSCIPVAICGNDVQESGEECDGTDLGVLTCQDMGYSGGTIGPCFVNCTLDTSGCTMCGNGTQEGSEQCDGTDLNNQTCLTLSQGIGNLACLADCTFDSSGCQYCGNDVLQGTEKCDGTDLNDETCVIHGFDGGDLACFPNDPIDGTANDCTFDESDCYKCPDGTVDVPYEECDGTNYNGETCLTLGFNGGNIACKGDCSFDITDCYGCGDNVIDPGEECDGTALGGATCQSRGYTGGTLACYPNDDADGSANNCTFNETACYKCGDGNKDSGEECDGTDFGTVDCTTAPYNMNGGNLVCRPDCTIDASGCTGCGNNTIEGTEDCDGTALGGRTCVDEGFDCGVLACASCIFDTSGCKNNPDCSSLTCGNNTIDGVEQCDGTDLGGATCQSEASLPYGILGCASDCMSFDTSGCYQCEDCRDCNNQACNSGFCGSCTNSSQCCAPYLCMDNWCQLF